MSQPTSGFELREHTADIALYVWAENLEGLFLAAAEGLYAAIGVLEPAGPFRDMVDDYELTAPDTTDLLGDFLAELLFIFEQRQAELIDIQVVELDESKLRFRADLQPLDLPNSIIDREIKAVTRHNLEIISADHPYETTIILDL